MPSLHNQAKKIVGVDESTDKMWFFRRRYDVIEDQEEKYLEAYDDAPDSEVSSPEFEI